MYCPQFVVPLHPQMRKEIFLLIAETSHRGVEQLVARQAHNLEVVRSSRAPATQLIDTHESEMKRSSIRTSFFIQAHPLCRNGGMVDTRDLKSLGHCARAGSSPASGTHPQPTLCKQVVYRGFFISFSYVTFPFTFVTSTKMQL